MHHIDDYLGVLKGYMETTNTQSFNLKFSVVSKNLDQNHISGKNQVLAFIEAVLRLQSNFELQFFY